MQNIELQNILNNNCSASEKIEQIEAYKNKTLEDITTALNEIFAEYKYCPRCDQYYKQSTWAHIKREENREYCSFLPLAEWEQPEYKRDDFIVEYTECPVGHLYEIAKHRKAY